MLRALSIDNIWATGLQAADISAQFLSPLPDLPVATLWTSIVVCLHIADSRMWVSLVIRF